MVGSLAPETATAEIASVVFPAFLVWASALVQHFSNTINRGAGYVLGDRSVAPEMTGFFGRATRTLSNNMESALMYIPPALLVVSLGKEGAVSHYSAFVYIVVRSIFSISYWLKIPAIRSVAWLVGMMCCAAMYFAAVAAPAIN
jgi:uncharacterized MAPEG superfamily protein